MRPRRIYWRKKGKGIILEGRLENGKPISIWTLPEANRFYTHILANASFLEPGKREEIYQKMMRLAIRDNKPKKAKTEVQLMKLKRTPEKDAEPKLTKEEIKELAWELSRD